LLSKSRKISNTLASVKTPKNLGAWPPELLNNGRLRSYYYSLRSAESPDEGVQRLGDLVKRQRQFGDILMSSDIKQVPICGMSFGSVELPRQTADVTDSNKELVPVIQSCCFTANIYVIVRPLSTVGYSSVVADHS